MSAVNADKLSKLQAKVIATGSGAPRRKVKKTHKPSSGDDKKLQAAVKKLGTQPIPGIEEINMFMDDGNVLHFDAPKVQAAVAANTFMINGFGEEKELTELVPGILTQLGPDSLASLRKIAEAYQAHAAAAASSAGNDEVPELVENFEAASLKDKVSA